VIVPITGLTAIGSFLRSSLNSSLYIVKYENAVFYLTKDFFSNLMSLKTE
jgi:hypothetical protein